MDLCFGVGQGEEEAAKHHQYVKNMKKELQNAYQLAAKAAFKNHERNKRLYDAQVKNQVLQEGDRVLVRNLGLKGQHKLQDRWNSLPYVVIAKLPNLPVYRVKPDRGPGSIKVIHRDHLLPIGYLVRFSVPSEKRNQSKPPVTRAQRAKSYNESPQLRPEEFQDEWDSESEEDSNNYLPQFDLSALPRNHQEGAHQRGDMPHTDVNMGSNSHDLPEVVFGYCLKMLCEI